MRFCGKSGKRTFFKIKKNSKLPLNRRKIIGLKFIKKLKFLKKLFQIPLQIKKCFKELLKGG